MHTVVDVGYRGKVVEREAARAMRADGATLHDIATALGVSRSSASVWVRDVAFTPSPRRTGPRLRPHPAAIAKAEEIAACDAEGVARIGTLSDEAFLAAGIALYAGEGAKTDGKVMFANTDPTMVRFFCAWFRKFFAPEETRFTVRVYLHQGLDLEAAESFWSSITGVERAQFRAPYRAVADPSIRRAKHEHGCVYVSYNSTTRHREIMGLMRALLASEALPG